MTALENNARPRGAPVLVLCLLIVLATVIAYIPTYSAGYVWDDDDYVTRNATLKMEGLDGLKTIWTPRNTPQYYPVVFTSFWIEEHLYSDAPPDETRTVGTKDPTGYHVVNVAIHAANAVLLLIVLLKIGIGRTLACVAAAVFALHPVHVETVAWITERKNVLALFFYLLAALAWMRFERARMRRSDENDAEPTKPDNPWAWYALSLVLFVFALLSKSITASLPIALLLVAIYWKRPMAARVIVPLIPMLILGAIAGLHTGWLERHHVGALGPDWDLNFAERTVIASRAFLFYPWKIILPPPLMFNYPRWDVSLSPISWWPMVVSLLLAAGLLWLWVKRGIKAPALCAIFYAVSIFPALGFANLFPSRFSFVADHFQYIASIGTILLVVLVVRRVLPARPFVVIMIVVAAVFGILTFRQARHYESERTLYTHAIAHNPDAWLMHTNLARVYLDEAQEHLSRARPNDALEATRLAEEHARASIRIKPSHYRAPWTLAEALRLQNRSDEAIDAQLQSIALLHEELDYHTTREYDNKVRWALSELAISEMLLGRLYELADDPDNAIAAYTRALDANTRADATPQRMRLAHDALARLYSARDDLVAAAPHFETILRMYPDDVPSLLALGELQRRRGNYTASRELYEHAANAITSREEELQVMYRVGWLMATADDPTVRNPFAAVGLAERFVIATQQTSADAFDLLAAAYAAVGRFDEAVRMTDEALTLTEAYELDALGEAIRERAALYRDGKPYVE